MKTLKYILLLGVVCGMSSCSDFLEEDPQTALKKEVIYNSINTASAALTGCYSIIGDFGYCGFNYFYSVHVTSGVGAGLRNNDGPLTQINPPSTHPQTSNTYNGLYKTIGSANDIIQGLEASSLEGSTRDRILGEAYFLRAHSYFNLVRLFGDVPMVTKAPTSYEETQLPLTPEKTIYEEVIIPGFEKAFQLLPEAAKQVKGHPHQMAAKAYLAKVYQTLAGNDDQSSYWQKTYDAAKEVYDSHAYKLVRPYSNLFGEFNNNNEESIFELQLGVSINNAHISETTLPRGYEELVNIKSPNGPWGKCHPTPYLFNHFDEGDPRRDASFIYGQYRNVLEKNVARQNVMLFPTTMAEATARKLIYVQDMSDYPCWKKYVSPSMTTSVSTNANFVFCRFSDIIMVMAEAANELGRTSEAADLLDEVLDRARDKDGNGVIDSATEVYPLAVSSAERGDKLAMRERIFRERLKEFTGEGDEWYTIRRRGLVDLERVLTEHNTFVQDFFAKQGISKLPRFVYLFDVTPEGLKTKLHLPFPANEINRNPVIQQ